MAEEILIRGENGCVMPHKLPLPEGIASRLAKGYLTRVNADGTPWTPEPDSKAAPDRGVVAASKPTQSAPKADWVAWAVSQGAEPDNADAMTKADLVEQYGQ